MAEEYEEDEKGSERSERNDDDVNSKSVAGGVEARQMQRCSVVYYQMPPGSQSVKARRRP